jgi:hypothetical protein
VQPLIAICQFLQRTSFLIAFTLGVATLIAAGWFDEREPLLFFSVLFVAFVPDAIVRATSKYSEKRR